MPLQIDDAEVDRLRRRLPELPAEMRSRIEGAGVDPTGARTLVAGGLAALFDEAVAEGADAIEAAKWITGEVTAFLNRESLAATAIPLDGADIAELVAMVDGGDLSSTAAKQVLEGVLAGEGRPRAVAEGRDLIQIRDEGALAAAVADVAAAHPDELARIAEGDDKVIGFLVGQVMRATGGKADPKRVSEMISEQANG